MNRGISSYALGASRFRRAFVGWLVMLLFPVPMLAATHQDGTSSRIERGHDFDSFVTGNPAAPRALHTRFLLALMGGGGNVDAAFAAMADHAGHGHIVVLRAVSDYSFDAEDGHYGELFAHKWGPVTSARTLVFHNREASFDRRVIEALRRADGIFIAGGDQANYVRFWKGTPVENALNAHVRANRPIGGSSAGLAIMGRYAYTAMDGGSMESKVALADPFDPGVTLESDFLNFRWLDRVITDTHFARRCRLGRLIVFVNRINRDHPPGDVVGIGVDEKTALLIGEDGLGHVAEGSEGKVWLVAPPGKVVNLSQGRPLAVEDLRIVRFGIGSTLDLKTRNVSAPFEETVDSIDGRVDSHVSFASEVLLRDVVPDDES